MVPPLLRQKHDYREIFLWLGSTEKYFSTNGGGRYRCEANGKNEPWAVATQLWVVTALELGAGRPSHFSRDARNLNLYMKFPECLTRCWFKKNIFKIVCNKA